MLISDIRKFSEIRYNVRAYLAYLFERNIPNKLPGVSVKSIEIGFDKMAHEIEHFDAFYILGSDGVQINDNISLDPKKILGKGENRSNKAYYYRAVREKRCVLSDPYPSSLTNELCVTASKPIYDENNHLKYIVCVDISLKDVLKLISPSLLEHTFINFSKVIYGFFALALFLVVAMLFTLAIKSFIKEFSAINISEMFETTIILTLALAIFDLVKVIFDEEVLGKAHKEKTSASKIVIRFIGSIIIALAIEALMLVFKFAITDPSQIIYAIYLIGGVAVLLIALSAYLWTTKQDKIKSEF